MKCGGAAHTIESTMDVVRDCRAVFALRRVTSCNGRSMMKMPNKVLKKGAVLACSAVLAMGVLAGCSSGTQPATETEAAPAAEAPAAATTSSDSKPAKDGFDTLTNQSIEVAGVEFSVPAYYGEPTTEGASTFYYAEPNTVFIMTQETDMSASGMTREQFDATQKDEFAAGVEEGGELTISSSKDREVAGLSARVFSAEGNLGGTNMDTHSVIFYNDATGVMGTIALVQTENAQFDYLDDFAKIVDSAKLVESEKPEAESEPAEEAQAESTADSESADSGEVDPELKQWLDEYEAVVDSYVEFMNNYDPNDLSSMTTYLDMLQQYSEFAAQVDSLDTSNMSAADYAYYIEVTSRCAEKLIGVL